MSKVQVMDHPLIQHKINYIRNEEVGSKEFREIVGEIASLMCYEATRDLKMEDVKIKTPICEMTGKQLSGKKLAVVPILRAGLGMVDGMLNMIPSAKVGHIGLYRDPQTYEPVEYYCKLPSDCDEREVFVVDPMLATGGSCIAALQMLKDKGVKHLRFMCIIAALVLLTQKSAVSSQKTEEDFTEMVTTEETGQVQEQNLPTIYIQQEEELQAPSPFRIENYYITERVTAYNHYYIDNDGILWGNGYNENGQLGTGSYETDFDKGQFDDVRIADHVVSVDADWNNNFCIYLTEDGNLYGLGLNMAGLLLGKDTVKQVYSDMDNDRVCTPTLLMKNVRYARAGREAIIVLKEAKQEIISDFIKEKN